MKTDKPSRPLLRYHGGKWKLAPWIIGYFPKHKIYTEAYGGGASVLLRKSRSYAEVYNDLDDEIVNLFRVLRSKDANELIRQIAFTPFSRHEFDDSYVETGDPVEQARRTVFRFAAGHSTTGANANKWKTGFRCNVTRSGSTPAQDWSNMPNVLLSIVARLQGVVIENLPAIDVLRKYDDVNALHYVDPPYPFSTRNERWAGSCYRHEMTDADHADLAGVLRNLKGAIVVSGYKCDLYDELFDGWRFVQRSSHADGALDRIETLWISPGATCNLTLFEYDDIVDEEYPGGRE